MEARKRYTAIVVTGKELYVQEAQRMSTSMGLPSTPIAQAPESDLSTFCVIPTCETETTDDARADYFRWLCDRNAVLSGVRVRY